jgi:hypothetical protein
MKHVENTNSREKFKLLSHSTITEFINLCEEKGQETGDLRNDS